MVLSNVSHLGCRLEESYIPRMEDIFVKVLRRVEPTNASIMEIYANISNVSYLVDSHSTSVKYFNCRWYKFLSY